MAGAAVASSTATAIKYRILAVDPGTLRAREEIGLRLCRDHRFFVQNGATPSHSQTLPHAYACSCFLLTRDRQSHGVVPHLDAAQAAVHARPSNSM